LRATRGLPHNVTTEMDLLLWQTTQTIARDADGSAALRKPDPALLARQFETEGLPPVAQNAIAAFLRRYGMRGIAEIDVGHARWGDQPQPIIQTLQSYAQIDDPDRAPDAVFARGAADAEAAIEQIVRELRGTPRGWIKARLARWLARRTRELAGLRETPKLTIVRVLGLIRAGLLESGRDLADAGAIDQPDDLFFLRVDELRALAGGEQRDWRSLIDERRASYARELRRRQVPRLLLSDGRAFFDGVAATSADDGALIGSPVSPGTVEGVVHVVWEPHKTRLAPGEILVCHGTDPAWTPLFLAAGGLITEVGGLMTHGSVVAREYGIPAVVGVDHATTRLHTGQRVRVDGSSGRVTLLTSDGALIDHLVE
jgi:rifampicin phosphotransferase